jgi:hypothetical protein
MGVRCRDGKIVEELAYIDAPDWQTQLGYMLTPPASGTVVRTQSSTGSTARAA